MKPLPADTARCNGGNLPECEHCYRRTTPPINHPWVCWMEPAKQSPCESFKQEPQS